VVYALPTVAIAQDGTLGDTDIQVFDFSGNFTTEAYGYATSRDVNRRAPLGSITSLNTSFSILGFSSGLNIRYNTDDSNLRQSMNQIGFRGNWRWVGIAAGDFSPSWSRYSIRGKTLRGGQVELTPGAFTLDFIGGQARRAVQPRQEGQATRRTSAGYSRMVYGARVGYGERTGSHFMLSGFYGRDDENSLDLAGITGGDIVTPPAENLLISPELQLSFMNRQLQFGGRGSVSAFTRDVTSSSVDASDAGVPEFVQNIFPVRSSTRVSYAGLLYGSLDYDLVDIDVEYERIEPGFKTMGIRSMRDDRERYGFSVGLDLFDNRIRFGNSLDLDRDNLQNTRTRSQNGLNYNTDLTARISPAFTITAGYGLSLSELSGEEGMGGSEYSNHTGRLQTTLTFSGDGITHNINSALFYQTFESVSRLEDDTNRTDGYTLNANLLYTTNFSGGLRLNAGLNGLTGDASGSELLNAGLNLGIGYTFLSGRLNANLDARGSRNQVTRTSTTPNGAGSFQNISWQLGGGGRLSWRVFDASRLQFSVRTTNNYIGQGAGAGFNEVESRLSFSHRF